MLIYIVTILQIVLESLPVSSSGHIALASCFTHDKNAYFFSEPFMHMLHIPTACMLAIFFLPHWFFLLRHYRRTWKIIIKLIWFSCVVDLITALFFLFVRRSGWFSIPLFAGFALTGIILFSLRFKRARGNAHITFLNACILGCVQGIALLPGISRFAAVYGALYWLGFNWKKSFSITWMVQFPLIMAASAKSILWYVHAHQDIGMTNSLMACIMGATIFGFAALYGAYCLARARMMWLFSFYMVVPCLLAYWYCR